MFQRRNPFAQTGWRLPAIDHEARAVDQPLHPGSQTESNDRVSTRPVLSAAPTHRGPTITAPSGGARAARPVPAAVMLGRLLVLFLRLASLFSQHCSPAQPDLAGRVDIDYLDQQLLAFMQLVPHVAHPIFGYL